MKKLLLLSGLLLMGVLFFSCDKDGDGCYDIEEQIERSTDQDAIEEDRSRG